MKKLIMVLIIIVLLAGGVWAFFLRESVEVDAPLVNNTVETSVTVISPTK